MPKPESRSSAQVIDLFTRKPLHTRSSDQIIRLSPEYDGLGMLYENDSSPGKLFSLKIMAWALLDSGKVVGLVPWLSRISPCPDLSDPLNGHWEGYYNTKTGQVFYDAPDHKCIELKAAADYYCDERNGPQDIIQEIPDTIGTHAVMMDEAEQEFEMISVFSWQLRRDGSMQGMLIDHEQIRKTPVLLGDQCLYSATSDPQFKYFFQYRIANKIKEHDPEALRAIALLINP